MLVGPVREGARWETYFTVSGPGVAIRATGTCNITSMTQREVLGKQALCAQHTCPMESKELSVIESGSYCRGIGQAETQLDISYKTSQQAPIRYGEKLLIEIK